VESLKDLAFNAEDLGGPAAELDLVVKQSEAVTRSPQEGLFANPSLMKVAFSEEVIEAGHNSDVIELAAGHFVVLRVRKHNPSEIKALDLVREEILAILTETTARNAVAAAAERAVMRLRDGSSIEQFAIGEGYEWQVELGADRRNRIVPAEILQRIFALPDPGKGASSIDFVLTAEGDARVFELARVSVGQYQTLTDMEQQGLQQQVSVEYSQLINAEYQQGLRDSADISVL
jgi:peptidyl-prolyl cis-trans isomerase D